MQPILLAVAVHDKGEARLERALPDEIRVQAGVPLKFRVSYALHDSSDSREDATVAALLTMKGRKPVIAEIGMHDLPLLDDSRFGDLLFEMPGLPPGDHVLHYAVALETSDRDILMRDEPNLQEAKLSADLNIRAVISGVSSPSGQRLQKAGAIDR